MTFSHRRRLVRDMIATLFALAVWLIALPALFGGM